MDYKDIRTCITNVGKELGWKIRSMYPNPLTGVWRIDIGDGGQVSFKPTPGATVEECTEQFKLVLGCGEVVIEEEIDNLRLRTPDNILYAMQRLQEAGEPAVGLLIKALLDPNEPGFFRSRVAGTLAMIGSPKAIEPLIEMLNDADAEVHWHGVKALEEIGDEKAIGPLERLAATDTGRFSITPTLHVSVRDDARKAVNQIKARMS